MSAVTVDPDVRAGLWVPCQHTSPEIAKRCADLREKDFYGFHTASLLAYLPHDYARPFIKVDCTSYEWARDYPLSRPPLIVAKRLLPTAWERANARRALATYRCMEFFKALFWLAGYDEDFVENFDNYEFFGKPQLVLASEMLLYDWRKQDDGKWCIGASHVISNRSRDDAINECLALVERTKAMERLP